MAGKEVPYFSPQAARTIWDTVQRIIKSGLLTRLERRDPLQLYDCWIGKTTSSITARSGDVWGYGTFKPYLIKDDDGDAEVIKDADGNDIEFRVYNGAEDSVANGVWVQCKTVGGRPCIDVEYCV